MPNVNATALLIVKLRAYFYEAPRLRREYPVLGTHKLNNYACVSIPLTAYAALVSVACIDDHIDNLRGELKLYGVLADADEKAELLERARTNEQAVAQCLARVKLTGYFRKPVVCIEQPHEYLWAALGKARDIKERFAQACKIIVNHPDV